MRQLSLIQFTLWFCLLSTSACSHPPTEPDTTAGSTSPRPASVDGKTVCAQQNDTRYLEVKTKGDGTCDLLYTKFGTEVSVAGGSKSHCDKVHQQIKTQLMRSGFSCE